jgi:TetR/AcrR family transcriptional regulator
VAVLPPPSGAVQTAPAGPGAGRAAPAIDSGWRRRAVEGSDLVRRAAEKTVQQAEHLIAAARVLYYETSGEPFTIQQLADRAGVSLQTFYRYFRSKDELLIALLEEYLRELADRARQECEAIADPVDRLRAAIRWSFRYSAAKNTPYHSLITREHLRLSIDYPAGVRAAGEPYRVLLRETLSAIAADGRLPATADTDRLATFIKDLITSQVHNQTLGIDPASPNGVADELVRFCLAGCGITPPGPSDSA